MDTSDERTRDDDEDQTDSADNTVNEELEDHDLPALPVATPADGSAPAA